MLGILKKNEAGYIRGVMDHLAEDTKCGSGETGLERGKAKRRKTEQGPDTHP